METKYKIYFTTWHYDTAERFTRILSRLTPNCSGKYKNIEATLDKKEADYFVVFGGTKEDIDPKRAIYFGCHPKGPSGNYKSFLDVPCLVALPLSHFLSPAEVWINYTYDELKAMQPVQKKHNLACIMTYQTHRKTYSDRIRFMQHFMPQYPQCHLYGRLSKFFKEDPLLKDHYKGPLGYDNYDHYAGDHLSGKNILIDYRYSLEYDQGPTENYLCERFHDALLLWTMPIYYGSTNVEKYFPKNSFRYVDISSEDPEQIDKEVKKVIKITDSDYREKNISAIAEARDLILDKYQTFAYVHDIVNNIDSYITEWERIKQGRLSL